MVQASMFKDGKVKGQCRKLGMLQQTFRPSFLEGGFLKMFRGDPMHELRITSKQHQTGSNSCFQQQMSAKITCYLEKRNEKAEQKINSILTVNVIFMSYFLILRIEIPACLTTWMRCYKTGFWRSDIQPLCAYFKKIVLKHKSFSTFRHYLFAKAILSFLLERAANCYWKGT